MKKSGGLRKALVIGISDYDNCANLSFCKKDGEEMHRVLKSLGYQISDNNKLIGYIQSNQMKDAVIDFFNSDNVNPEDTLIFYYSGHGIQNPIDGTVYLAPSEIDSDVPIRRGFSLDDLRLVIQNSISTRIVAILDCCHSGAGNITKGKINDESSLILSIQKETSELEQGEGKCILAASQSYQKAYPFEEYGYSVFTYFLIEALKGDKDAVDINGYLTPYSLNKFIYKKINRLPLEKRPRQKPVMKVEASGDIILAYFPQLATKLKVDNPVASLDAADIITEGNIHLDKKEYQRALEYYQKVITDPNLAKAWVNKGLALYELHKYEESLKALDVGIELDPSNAIAWSNKGLCLMNLYRYDEAIESFQKSIELNRKDFARWDTLGLCLTLQNRFDEAVKSFDLASELDDSSALVWYGKGEILFLQKKYDEAIMCFDKAIELDNFYSLPWYRKGEILFLKTQFDEAIGCLDKAIEYANRGKLTMHNSNIITAYSVKGSILMHLQKYNEAIACIDKLLELAPNDAGEWNLKGVALTRLGRHKEALQCFERSLELDSTDNTVLDNKIYALDKLRESSGHTRLGNKYGNNKKNKYYTSDGKPVYE